MPWYLLLLIAAGVIVLPFVIGEYLARRFKMPDYGWKIGLILFSIAASLAITISGWPPKRGIDLRGGYVVIFEVEQPQQGGNQAPIPMDRLVAAIKKRVDPSGVKEISIRPYGENRIEIIIPEVDEEERQRIEQRISRAGTLEFRIIANRRDHADLIEKAMRSNRREIVSGGRVRAKWVPVNPKYEDQYRDRGFAVRPSPTDKDRIEVLVVVDRHNVTGDYLRSISQGIDRRGRPSVNFRFNSQGAQRFGRLTGENTPDPNTGFQRQLGIILDGELYNAPNINDRITDSGEISGNFTPEEVDDLIAVLRAGSLPATLSKEPVSSQVIDPTLGADTIEKGRRAIIISLVAVMVFIVIYYRFAGIVACFALVLNLLLILSLMIALKAAFTLPGLAGLVLTVGMSVDANVLIFERIREELKRGAAVRMAIRNGFGKAMSTVIDANVTTLITATVLYVIGSDQVRGFAVTLWLGIVMSLYTAIFCSRVIFDIAERQRWLKQLHMMQLIGTPNIDFIGKRWLASAVSGVLIVVGIAGVTARGVNLLNIDFTGGTVVELQFERPHEVAEVRAKVSKALPDVSVSRLTRSGEEPGLRYQINTSEQDIAKVEQTLIELFDGDLARNHMTIAELAQIEPASGSPAPEQGSAPDGEAQQPDSPPAQPSGDQQSSDVRRSPFRLASFAAENDDSSDAAATAAPAGESQPATAPNGEQPKADAKPDLPDSAPSSSTSEKTTVGATAESTSAERPATSEQTAGESGQAEAEGAEDIFVGGTEAVLKFALPVGHDTLADWIETALDEVGGDAIGARYDLAPSGEEIAGTRRSLAWRVRIALPPDLARKVFDAVQRQAEQPYFPSSANVGSKVAGNTRQQAIYAMLASLLFIVGYIWIRFQRVAFGLAAVVALVHDVLIVLGALALSYWVAQLPFARYLLIEPFKIDLPIVAALLTIIGYSLNDTIVVFDRIREIRGKSPLLTAEMINQSINMTLSRTLLTSLTTLLAVVVLYIGGGEGIRAFAFALLIGVIVGTYSSIFIASPALYWLIGKEPEKAAESGRQAAVAAGAGS